MARVKKVARENEFRERRQILVASGYEESKIRRWNLMLLRVKSLAIISGVV